MNILVVNWTWYPSGGDWTYVSNLCNLLVEKGHQVIPFSMKDERNFHTPSSKYFIEGINYRELNKNKSILNGARVIRKTLYSVEAKKNLEQLLSENRVDLAILNNIHHYLTPSSIIPVLQKHKIPVVWTLHDYVILCPNTTFISKDQVCEKCKPSRYYHCTLNRCKKGSLLASSISSLESYFNHFKNPYRFVDFYICPSKFIYNKFLEFGFKEEKLIQIYNLFDFSSIDQRKKPEGIQRDYIVYVGNLLKVKGVHTLIQAVANLPVDLFIIGDGEYAHDLSLLKDSLKLENVHFLGKKPKEEVLGYMEQSKFLVIPSEWYENMPYSLIEPMLLGKAVIGARIGGIPEMVVDGITGLTYEPGDAEALRVQIAKLLQDENMCKTFGENARKHVMEQVSKEAYYRSLEVIFEKLNLG